MTADISHEFRTLIDSWLIALEAERKSQRTIESYALGTRHLLRYAAEHDAHTLDELTPELLRRWLVDQADNASPSTVLTRYAAAKIWLGWCVSEGELQSSPFDKVQPPTVPEKHTPTLTVDQLRTLLADCDGPDFVSRRDAAMVTLFVDTGCRVSELINITLDDIDLRAGTAKIIGKGSRPRILPLGARTRQALDRYMRVRRRMKYGSMPWLWLSSNNKGKLTRNGVLLMLRRRSERIGFHVHPHMFRHTFADAWLRAGGGESDLMELAGWRSRQMLTRYAAANRAERAREAHRRLSPMDHLD